MGVRPPGATLRLSHQFGGVTLFGQEAAEHVKTGGTFEPGDAAGYDRKSR